jgi:hypothetical protein
MWRGDEYIYKERAELIVGTRVRNFSTVRVVVVVKREKPLGSCISLSATETEYCTGDFADTAPPAVQFTNSRLAHADGLMGVVSGHNNRNRTFELTKFTLTLKFAGPSGIKWRVIFFRFSNRILRYCCCFDRQSTSCSCLLSHQEITINGSSVPTSTTTSATGDQYKA